MFAGTSFVQVPLSPDYQIIYEFLSELDPAYMPQGGTDYAGMLRAGFASGSFNASRQYVGGAVVASRLLESRPDDALGLAVAPLAAQAAVPGFGEGGGAGRGHLLGGAEDAGVVGGIRSFDQDHHRIRMQGFTQDFGAPRGIHCRPQNLLNRGALSGDLCSPRQLQAAPRAIF